jgi:hypothetical protein
MNARPRQIPFSCIQGRNATPNRCFVCRTTTHRLSRPVLSTYRRNVCGSPAVSFTSISAPASELFRTRQSVGGAPSSESSSPIGKKSFRECARRFSIIDRPHKLSCQKHAGSWLRNATKTDVELCALDSRCSSRPRADTHAE